MIIKGFIFTGSCIVKYIFLNYIHKYSCVFVASTNFSVNQPLIPPMTNNINAMV